MGYVLPNKTPITMMGIGLQVLPMTFAGKETWRNARIDVYEEPNVESERMAKTRMGACETGSLKYLMPPYEMAV
jgi:hypothetical protein